MGWTLWRLVPAAVRYRVKPAWWCLLGRAVVANCHLTGTLALGPDNRKALVTNNVIDLRPVLYVDFNDRYADGTYPAYLGQSGGPALRAGQRVIATDYDEIRCEAVVARVYTGTGTAYLALDEPHHPTNGT